MIYEFKITYDGLTGGKHHIDLGELSESLAGFNRILSVVGHFEQTLTFATKQSVHVVEVYATSPENNCFSITAIVDFAQQQGLFQGAGGAVFGAIIAKIFGNRQMDKEEMKYLHEALARAQSNQDKAIEAQEKNFQSLLGTMNRMVDALAPAAKKALSPIGSSCETITMTNTSEDKPVSKWDITDKNRILEVPESTVTQSKQFPIYITELDIKTSSAKVIIQGDDESSRVKAKITDPSLQYPGNPYTRALDSRKVITVTAKAEISDGEIVILHISDA